MKPKADSKKTTASVQCLGCRLARLMQREQNPIIAVCTLSGEREVASARRQCAGYVRNPLPPRLQPWEDAKKQ